MKRHRKKFRPRCLAGGALGLAAATLATPAMAAPSMSLNVQAGPPTTSLAASASGFAANTLVDFYFDMSNVCLAIANGNGNASCIFNVPKEAQPQTHWISAVQRNTATGAQKPFTVRTDWGQLHGMDSRHTGFNPYENTIGVANVANLDLLWRVNYGKTGSSSSPVIWGGNVYLLADRLNAYSMRTGKLVAGFPKAFPEGPNINLFPSPAAANGKAYSFVVAANVTKLHAFDATTGAAIAGFPVSIGAASHVSPVVYNGNVYYTTGDTSLFGGSVRAVNGSTGARVESHMNATFSFNPLSTMSINKGVGFVGNGSDGFIMFDADSLNRTYHSAGGFGQVYGTAALIGGKAYFATNLRLVNAARLSTQEQINGFPMGSSSPAQRSWPAVAQSQIIIGVSGCCSNQVHSYDAFKGNVQWVVTLDSSVNGSPVVANGLVFVTTARALYALSAATGAALWSAAVDTLPESTPAVADGIVFVNGADGYLYAFSEHGVAPPLRLAGGVLGVRPALSGLKPSLSLPSLQKN